LKVAIPKEILEGERRVAVIPETVKRMTKKGIEVSVEAGAGEGSFITDREYQEAGAKMESSVESLYSSVDAILKINKPISNKKLGKHEIDLMKQGTVLVSFIYPLSEIRLVKKLAEKGITSFARDSIPRTTLAQSMDVLSSMSTVAGYKAVLIGANALGKFFPMFMTAAGTIAPAKVLILGAGVAGLQAVATARRLGAVVEVFDTRQVVKEQVESLGAKFVAVDSGEDAQTATGYAKELSEEYKEKQTELIQKHIMKSDICITTALIPGKKAPILITEQMVKGMKEGSVIVDLAAEQGGNCELTEPGKQIVKSGVTISGLFNIPSLMPVHASQMYSKNIEKFFTHLTDEKGFKMDLNDEITRGSVITHKGEIMLQGIKDVMAGSGGTS
jgi:H+-translocating NAD(P) transhydrogenase subunit alpha